MANQYFRFKQFTIQQQACAMKVCTDSCILGAYNAQMLSALPVPPKKILDIGGGTGLLALMIAQKSDACIDAIEIDAHCCEQMHENFKSSGWGSRLHAIHADVRHWVTSKKFDFIISNPPFFENDLKGADTRRTMAMHDASLLLSDLVSIICALLSEDGSFSMMVPAKRMNDLEQLFSVNDVNITSKLTLKHNADTPAFRVIYTASRGRQHNGYLSKELFIQREGIYSTAFEYLLKDYYLDL